MVSGTKHIFYKIEEFVGPAYCKIRGLPGSCVSRYAFKPQSENSLILMHTDVGDSNNFVNEVTRLLSPDETNRSIISGNPIVETGFDRYSSSYPIRGSDLSVTRKLRNALTRIYKNLSGGTAWAVIDLSKVTDFSVLKRRTWYNDPLGRGFSIHSKSNGYQWLPVEEDYPHPNLFADMAKDQPLVDENGKIIEENGSTLILKIDNDGIIVSGKKGF